MSTYNDVIKHLAYVHFIKKANLDEPWLSAADVYMPEGNNKQTPLTTFINDLINEFDRLVGGHTNDIAEAKNKLKWHGEAIIDLIYGQQRAGKDIKTLSEVANQHADALKAIQQYQTVHGLGDLFSSTLSALWMLHLGRKLKKLSRHPVLTTPIPEWYV